MIYFVIHFNPIYWDCACLIVNSGSLEDNSEEEIVDIYAPEGDDLANGITFEDLPDKQGKIRKTASTDYGKIAKAIGDIQKAGIIISLANINKSEFGFTPDVENNQILFGLKGMLNVGDDVVKEIINKRPYSSPRDFLYKVKPKKGAMISLIKGGAFDNMIDRKLCMAWYLWETCDKKSNLNLQNLATLMKYNLLPADTEERQQALHIYEFNRYLKVMCGFNKTTYRLDERAVNFLQKTGRDYLIISKDDGFFLDVKQWNDKVYQKWMDVYRQQINENKAEILERLNNLIFKENWDKYCPTSNYSAWEMEVLCFYYHEHELAHINNIKYGFVDFNKLPEEPVVERSFKKAGKTINIYHLNKICGTCIAKNKTKGIATLLTPTGVVNVKFRKEHFSLYDRQISQKQPDGKKKILEKSWFNRGNMIVVQGIRSGDDFIIKKYASTPGHSVYHIDEIKADGSLVLRDSRMQGDAEDE